MAITNFIPTIWSEELLHTLQGKCIAARHCNRNYEGDIKEAGSMVKILGLGPVTVSTYTKNTDLSSPETLSDNVTTLNINNAKYFNFQVDDVDQAQAVDGLMALALENAANALAKEADTTIFTTAAGTTHAITESALTVNNVVDRILEARTMLMEYNVSDPSDIVLEISPKVAELLLKAKVNLTGNSQTLEGGSIGFLGGMEVFVSNNLPKTTAESSTTYTCIARTRRAVAYAEQISNVEAYRPENRFADAMKGLHLYGAKIVYPDEICKLNLTV